MYVYHQLLEREITNDIKDIVSTRSTNVTNICEEYKNTKEIYNCNACKIKQQFEYGKLTRKCVLRNMKYKHSRMMF